MMQFTPGSLIYLETEVVPHKMFKDLKRSLPTEPLQKFKVLGWSRVMRNSLGDLLILGSRKNLNGEGG